jgi:hypothetical protein
MTRNGFNGILRAGWVMTAMAGHHGADCVLVEANGQEQEFAH